MVSNIPRLHTPEKRLPLYFPHINSATVILCLKYRHKIE